MVYTHMAEKSDTYQYMIKGYNSQRAPVAGRPFIRKARRKTTKEPRNSVRIVQRLPARKGGVMLCVSGVSRAETISHAHRSNPICSLPYPVYPTNTHLRGARLKSSKCAPVNMSRIKAPTFPMLKPPTSTPSVGPASQKLWVMVAACMPCWTHPHLPSSHARRETAAKGPRRRGRRRIMALARTVLLCGVCSSCVGWWFNKFGGG